MHRSRLDRRRSATAFAMPRGCLLSTVLFVLATTALPLAQAPDCTGVSTVFNTDPDLDGELTTVRIATVLRPVLVTSPPGDLDRLFIVEQDGIIRIFTNGALLPDPFLDVSELLRSPGSPNCVGGCNEQGLLGLAFHPDYDSNGWFFIYHTNTTGDHEIAARYTRDATDPNLADPSTRTEILVFDSSGKEHNAGMMAFSPSDGYLYIARGDGGGQCDLPGEGQNLNTLNAKMIRINVDDFDANGYSTAGNPFDGEPGMRSEIWAYGLRNPWRFSFDRITSTMFIGDVGQWSVEELNCQPASSTGGENYGWNSFEGSTCPVPACGDNPCDIPGHQPPIVEYTHTDTRDCVTGGYVYRGCRMPDLQGTYFYADWGDQNYIRSFRTDVGPECSVTGDIDRAADFAPIGGHNLNLIGSFGEDERGELYIADWSGEVYKIVPDLSIMEVSGRNAPPFLLGDDWAWEDLERSTSHPVADYKIYRSTGGPTGPFDCIEQIAANGLLGGDTDIPPSAGVYHYLVTATFAAQQLVAGARSDGTLRTVNSLSPCPN